MSVLKSIFIASIAVYGTLAVAGPNSGSVDIPSQTMPHIVDNPKPEDFRPDEERKKEAKLFDIKLKDSKNGTKAEEVGNQIVIKP